jgi:hypothetical protein
MRALGRTLAATARCRAPAAQPPAQARARCISGTARLWVEAESPGCALQRLMVVALCLSKICAELEWLCGAGFPCGASSQCTTRAI